jgi:hypothetical protein
VVAYVKIDSITKQKPNTFHMQGSALQLFGLFHHSDIIFSIKFIHFDYQSPTFEIPYGIRSIHRKVGQMGIYHGRV